MKPRNPFVCSYCSDWLKRRHTVVTPQRGWGGREGVLVFVLPFEMLLQLPEQKLHCHPVMALRSHGAVRQQDHGHLQKYQSGCLPSGLCSVLFSPHPTTTRLASLAAAYGCIRPHREAEAACQLIATASAAHSSSSPSMSSSRVRVADWRVNDRVQTEAGRVVTCDHVTPGGYINHQQGLACGPVISLLPAP